jgi:hypothetical protein
MPDPDLRVHQQLSFICGPGTCITSYAERPERDIAAAVLEDASDWLGALRRLERRHVPPGVEAALSAAHEAAIGWVEWLDRQGAHRV